MNGYKTQMEAARRGIVTPELRAVARDEGVSEEFLLSRVAAGTVAIPANVRHTARKSAGVGEGLELQRRGSVAYLLYGEVAAGEEIEFGVNDGLRIRQHVVARHKAEAEGNPEKKCYFLHIWLIVFYSSGKGEPAPAGSRLP